MFRQLAQFEHEIENFVAHFHLPINTPIPIAKEMLCHFLKIIGQIEDQSKAAEEQKKVEETPKIEPISQEEAVNAS